MLSYAGAMRRLSSYDKFGSKPGLARISKLCFLLGSPQEKFKSILVAGTNGKGSTTAMISSILRHAGYRTASYFSPHVFDFRERMQIRGKMIPKKECAAALSKVFDAIDARLAMFEGDTPTFFEITTAAAFAHFASKRVDFAVLEAGLGGRLDATNICGASLSIITSIGIDHARHLGRSEKEIAYEKAGIAKKGRPLVCASKISGSAKLEIIRQCRAKGAKFTQPSRHDIALAKSARLSLAGNFQDENAATAICAARHIGIARRHVLAGLRRAFAPCRLQAVSKKPLVVFDCAHNPQAAKAAAESLPGIFGKRRPRILLFSSMKDKDYQSSLEILAPHFDAAVVFSPPIARAEAAPSLASAARKAGIKKAMAAPSPRRSLALAKRLAGRGGAVFACGSIYSLRYLAGRGGLRISQ